VDAVHREGGDLAIAEVPAGTVISMPSTDRVTGAPLRAGVP